MSITLTPEQERQVLDRLQSGRYSSAGDVISEALKLLEKRDRGQQDGLDDMLETDDRESEAWSHLGAQQILAAATDEDSIYDEL